MKQIGLEASILNEKGDKFDSKFGVLTPQLGERHQLLLTHGVKEATGGSRVKRIGLNSPKSLRLKAHGGSKTPGCFFSKFSYTQTVIGKKNAIPK